MTTANEIIKKALSYLGTKESPANSNRVIFNTHYYGREVSGSAYPWCCAFVWDIFRMCNAGDLFFDGKKTAYCPTMEAWAKSKAIWHPNTNGQPGDLCLMDFGKGRASHIGIVEKKNPDGSYAVIEGNTSASSNDNGGCVMRRTRYVKNIRGFARPEYSDSAAAPSASTPTTALPSSADTTAGTAPSFSAYTHTDFVKEVQAAIGAKADGIAGKETFSKTITVSKSRNNRHAVVRPLQKYLNSLGYDCGAVDGIAGVKFDSAVKAYQKANGCISDGEITAKKTTWKKLLKL